MEAVAHDNITNIASRREPTANNSVTVYMAEKFGMDPDAFEMTVRETCSPTGRESRPLTRPEFAAFLLVAKHYGLNPLTKEIYAFPNKSGGIVPVVSVDGWINLINSHPQCDGWDMEEDHAENGRLVSMTCSMYRKDRSRPVVVTEHLSECKRDTAPWKMEHRMLRHKTLIQAGRYTFGFSGIYDEDEAEKIADHPIPQRDVTPAKPQRKAPMPSDVLSVEHKPAVAMEQIQPVEAQAIEVKPVEQAAAAPARRMPPKGPPAAALAPETFAQRLARFVEAGKKATDDDMLQDAWDRIIEPVWDTLDILEQEDAQGAHTKRSRELGDSL